MNRRWICNDVWMDILPSFDHAQLGLKMALISPRFDALVDTHFDAKTELTLWKAIEIRKDNEMPQFFVEGKSEGFPLPDRPLPNKIRFKSLKILYIDHSAVISFLHSNKHIWDRGIKFGLSVWPISVINAYPLLMDSDENSPTALNLDTSFRTPLTSKENKIRKQRKINIGAKQWSLKPLKNTSKYSNIYEELLENGIESDYLICKICKKPVYKKNWHLISEHHKAHFMSNSIEKLKADYKHKITCAALKGKPFRFFETEEFHGIVTAFGQLCVAHANVGISCDSRSATPSRNGIAQAVRDRATGIDQRWPNLNYIFNGAVTIKWRNIRFSEHWHAQLSHVWHEKSSDP